MSSNDIMPCKYHYFHILNLAQIKNATNAAADVIHKQLYRELLDLPEKCKTTLLLTHHTLKLKWTRNFTLPITTYIGL